MKKSFTLIELLIVIGILAILVVTILITLNPSEAQKKARDAKRMKDLATLQALALQWINDGNAPISTGGCTTTSVPGIAGQIVCDSLSAGQVKSQPCSNNWLGVNLCSYTSSLPVDPLNSQQGIISYVNNGITISSSTTYTMRYVFLMSGGDYKIGVFQESKSNANNVNYRPWTTVSSGLTGDNLW